MSPVGWGLRARPRRAAHDPLASAERPQTRHKETSPPPTGGRRPHKGRSYRKAGRPKTNRATARHAVRATRETGSQAQRSAPGEGAGPPGLRLLAESPAVGASWNTGITRATSAQENNTQAATRRLPNDRHLLTCRPPRGRPLPAQGSSPAWAETRRAPPRGSVARGIARAIEPGPKEADENCVQRCYIFKQGSGSFGR